MLTAIRKFFDQRIAAQPDEPEASAERRAQIAAAVLLVEVARSDQNFSDAARQAVLGSVQRKFGLSPVEAQELLTSKNPGPCPSPHGEATERLRCFSASRK